MFLSKLRYINPEMLAALLRTAVQVGGGIVAQRGWASDDEVSLIGGALVTILVTLWGMWTRTDKNLIESASSVPAVNSISVDHATESASATLTANPKINA